MTSQADQRSVVLDVRGMAFATEKMVVESALGDRSGVTAVLANPVNQTASVTYDPASTDVAELRGWVQECGFHCAGRSVPEHICALPPSAAASPEVDDASDHRGAHAGHDLEGAENSSGSVLRGGERVPTVGSRSRNELWCGMSSRAQRSRRSQSGVGWFRLRGGTR